MIRIVIITFLFQQYIQITQGVTCASNPCGLVPGLYDPSTGYCCTNIGPTYTDSICTCPNNIPYVVNGPCRSITTTNNQATCTRTCVNGGVCNIVNGQQVCWCQLGFSGPNCEIQAAQNRCSTGLCLSGTCYEQTIGTTIYAYCQCTPGYRGPTCNQNYFTCLGAGIYPDTAQCAIGRYFYCQQANATPITATCPQGQKFNRFTNQCDSTYQCT